jgi:hypothetical protein
MAAIILLLGWNRGLLMAKDLEATMLAVERTRRGRNCYITAIKNIPEENFPQGYDLFRRILWNPV